MKTQLILENQQKIIFQENEINGKLKTYSSCGNSWIGRYTHLEDGQKVFFSTLNFCFKRNCPVCSKMRYKVNYRKISPVIDEIVLQKHIWRKKGLISHYEFTLKRNINPFQFVHIKPVYKPHKKGEKREISKYRGVFMPEYISGVFRAFLKHAVKMGWIKGKYAYAVEPKPSISKEGYLHLHFHCAFRNACNKEEMREHWENFCHLGGYVYATYSSSPYWLKDYLTLRSAGLWREFPEGKGKGKPSVLVSGDWTDAQLNAMKGMRWFGTGGIKLRKNVSYLEIMLEQKLGKNVKIKEVVVIGRVPAYKNDEKPPDEGEFLRRLAENE